MVTKQNAVVEDLYNVPENGKAELVNGEIVHMSPTGHLPSRAASNIYISLRQYELEARNGNAYADNTGFIVNLEHRKSLSPDAAYFTGPLTGMRFLEGAPLFAVEVRSENDYGNAAEREMEAKRMDYFAAGTLLVWDVDLLSPETIKAYRADDPYTAKIFRQEEIADAEPFLPDWRFPVDDLFL